MKRIALVALSILLILSLLVGCGTSPESGDTPSDTKAPIGDTATQKPADGGGSTNKKIVIGASPSPHAEILGVVKEILAMQNIELEIVEFSDFVQPNLALQDGTIDANYFQHLPYLENFNAENNTTLVSLGMVHYEPFGIYPGKTKTLADLKDGATVSVPNDATNEARALMLLEAQGLIKLKADAGLLATVNDIIENPKNLKINEIEAAQLPRTLEDVDIAIINGNYAIEAGLSVADDALAVEDANSIGPKTYGNVIAVRAGDENRPELVNLLTILRYPKVKNFMIDNYKGGVVPLIN